MATNLKGQGGVKGMLLLHGEKIAIAVVGAIAIWFVYKSIKLPHLEPKYQADELHKQVSQVSTQLTDFSWTKAVELFPDKVKKAEPIDAKNDPTVKVEPYETSPSFDTPVVASMTLRTDPPMLKALEVRGTGGSGLFAFVDEKIRAERELKRRAEEDERNAREKKAEDRRTKEQQKGQSSKGSKSRPGRGGPEGGAMRDVSRELADPAHPKRRPVEGNARALGPPLQGLERIERAYWACVVAKVPIRQQLNLYEDAFKNARGPYDQARDFPHYYGYIVDRSEVVPGKPLDWKRVALFDGQHQSIVANKPIATFVDNGTVKALQSAAQQFWAAITPDVIDPRYADENLTLPLPPLVGRMWGSEATHPDIPLLADTPAIQQEAAPAATTPTPTAPANSDEFGSPSAAAPNGVPGPGPGPSPSAMFRRPSFGLEGGMGKAGPEGGRPGFSPEGGRPSAGGFTGTSDSNTLVPGVDFKLLRFFDYTVEPGKKYKYRVKLVLFDPNAGLPANTLAPAVLDRQAKMPRDKTTGQKVIFRMADDWSEPSPTVGIPLGGDVRLADAKIQPDKFNDEPSVTLLVEAFDVDDKRNAIQAAVDTRDNTPTNPKRDFRRGCVVNFVEDAEYLAEGGAFIDTQKDFKFLTGMTVLDIEGGTKISKESKDLTVPVRILVMGSSGQTYIRNEIDDKPYVEYHKALFEKPNEKHKGGAEGPGLEMPGRKTGPRTR